MILFLKTFGLAFACALALTPLAIWLAPKIGAMDVPRDNRRMHTKPVPRFGGIAIFLATLISCLAFVPMTQQLKGVLIGAAMIVALGIVDDIKGLRPMVKFAGQVVCTALPVIFGVRFTGFSDFFNPNPGAYISFSSVVSIICTFVWVVAIVNTINLVDGLDGLAAGISCIACLSVAYTFYIMGFIGDSAAILCVAGAAFGFLFYNFNPAKIFMGDAGSMFLGFMLANLSLMGAGQTKRTALFSALVPLVILALPIFDTVFAVVRRAVNHKPIMQADKGHLHHRIMAMGFGQKRTVLVLYCISTIMGLAGVLWTEHLLLQAGVLTLVGACLIVVFLGIGMKHSPQEQAGANAKPQKISEEQKEN